MNIGIDIRNIGKKRTGDEVVFFNLVKNLTLIDNKNKYKLFTDITDKVILEGIKNDLGVNHKNNFEIISLKTKNKFPWNFWAFPIYLYKKDPIDIYLTQYITPFFVSKKIKILTIVHDVSFRVYKQFIKFSDLFFLSILIPHSLRRADKIIGVSQFTRDEIIKFYRVKPEKVDWIHNAVNAEFALRAAELTNNDIQAVKEKYKLPEKYILYIGTLQPRKNIPVLLEAFKDVADPEIKLVIAGGKAHNFDQQINHTIEKYNLNDKAILPGFIDEEDKAAIIKGAEIFVFPSLYEGFGIPILEAMAVGTPVIASDIPTHVEISGPGAVLFNPHKPKQLAKIISDILNNGEARAQMSLYGKEHVINFSWFATAQRMVKIFEDLR